MNKRGPSHSVLSDLKCIPEESERLSGPQQQKPPFPQNPNDEPNDDITAALEPLDGCPAVDLSDDDVAITCASDRKTEGIVGKPVNSDENSQFSMNGDEDFELKTMFYLPEWRSASPPTSVELHHGSGESLKVILANVEALLSRSPPSLLEDVDAHVAAASPPQFPLHPFQVSFTLDIDDNDDEVMASNPENVAVTASDLDQSWVRLENREIHQSHAHVQESASRGKPPATDLTWEAIFDDDDEEEKGRDGGKEANQVDDETEIKSNCMNEGDTYCWDDVRDEGGQEWHDGEKDDSQMNNSMDLFGDDEAFLQMTIPDIPTPGVSPRTSPAALAAQNPCRSTDACGEDSANTLHVIAKAEKAQNPADMVESDQHGQQSSFNKSDDLFSVNFDLGYPLDDSDEDREDNPVPNASVSALPQKQANKTPLQSREPRLSTPRMPSEHSRREASSYFASPLTPKGDAFPSPITSTLARRTILPGTSSPRTPRTPSLLSRLKRRRLGHQVDPGSVCAAPLSPHPGRFFRSGFEFDSCSFALLLRPVFRLFPSRMQQ